MHFVFRVAFVACFVAWTRPALADEGRVVLRAGGMVAGDVMLHRPGVETRVRLHDGETVTLTGAEVLRVEYQAEGRRGRVALSPEAEVEDLRRRIPTRAGPGWMIGLGLLGVAAGAVVAATRSKAGFVVMGAGGGLFLIGVAVFLPIRNARIRRWNTRIQELELQLAPSRDSATMGLRLRF